MATPEQNQLTTPDVPADQVTPEDGALAQQPIVIDAPASTPQGDGKTEDQKKPQPWRDDRRSEIFARAKEKRQTETQPFSGDPNDPTALYGSEVDMSDLGELEKEAMRRRQEAQQTATGQPQAQQPAVAKPLNGIDPVLLGQKVPIIVDGEVQEVSIEDLTRNYQIDRAADKRFAAAQALLRQTQEFHRQGTPAMDGENFEPARQDNPDQQRQAMDDSVDHTELVEKIQLGSPEEARQALEQFVQAAVGKSPAADDPRRILAALEDHNSQQAVIAFAEKNPTIATHPAIQESAKTHIHREMAKDLLAAGFTMDQLRQQVPNAAILSQMHKQMRIDGVRGIRSTRELVDAGYQGAMAELGSLLGVPASQGGANQPAGLEQRQQRKENLQQQPAVRRLAPSLTPAQQRQTPEQARSAAVARMRQARGQAT